MKISFQLTENDFLIFQLYTATQSKNVARNRMRSRWLTTIAAALLSFNLLVTKSYISAAIMFFLTILIYLLYPKYHKWRLKKHFQKFISKNYATLFGQDESLEILEKSIRSKNRNGNAELPANELEILTEIPNYFYLKMKNGASIILPKKNIPDPNSLKREINRLKVPFEQNLSWEY